MDSSDSTLTMIDKVSIKSLFAQMHDLMVAVDRWRKLAKRMLRVEHIRFRGSVNDEVWERDLIIAPHKRWEKMKGERPKLACWSTARFGPLTLALSPPPIFVLSELNGWDRLDNGL